MTTPSSAESCRTCRFSDISEAALGGQCRRYPPTLFEGDSFFPDIVGDNWCGEWKPKQEQSP